MTDVYILEDKAAEGLNSAGVKLDLFRLEHLTRYLGKIVGINLKPLHRAAVHTPTQEEYVDLMKVLEAGGWRWNRGELPTSSSASWDLAKEATCLSASSPSFSHNSKDYFERNNYGIISSHQFYDEEKITPRHVEEIVRLHDCIKELLAERV